MNNERRQAVFTYDGTPIPLKRHRHTATGKTYDSQKKIKDDIRLILRAQAHRSGTRIEQLQCPVSLTCMFSFAWPVSKKKPTMYPPHTAKPDIDNLVKFVLDVASGMLLYDDRLVTQISAQKRYATHASTYFCLTYTIGQ